MKKLWFLGLLIIVLLALPVLAACGTTEESTTTAPPATTPTTAPPTTAAGGTATTAATTPPTTVGEPMKLYVGGTFALTGAYAEDCAAVLAGFEDYVKYVNDNKIIAPWYTDRVIPANLTFELKWGDDALAPDKALTIYEEQKSAGMLVNRVTGSPEGMAMKDLLIADKMGVTSQSMSAAYLTPPGNIFTTAPIYTDQMAALGEWFMENWKDTTRKPRLAYLTADSTLGRNVDVPELQAYLEKIGFEFVGAQYVPMVATAPPTTQLAWLKDNKVDFAIGCMINPGSQPTIKEAERLGMGPDLAYKITFGFANPAHLQIYIKGMGTSGSGLVISGDFCAQDAPVPGIDFANMLQDKYRPGKKNGNMMYLDGIVEAMMQVEAQRLAYLAKGKDMTSEDVLKLGFWQLKDFNVGDLAITPLTFGEGDPQGLDQVRIQQVQNGKIVELGAYPIRNIIPAPKK
jgi:ABC-type branched-subunit amino acid transport system substrate-binding protein